jgi:hypothetical protein
MHSCRCGCSRSLGFHNACMACLHADYWQLRLEQAGNYPLRCRSCLQPDELSQTPRRSTLQDIAVGSIAILVAPTIFPASFTIQPAVSLTDTSRPAQCLMAVVRLAMFAAVLIRTSCPTPVGRTATAKVHLELFRQKPRYPISEKAGGD